MSTNRFCTIFLTLLLLFCLTACRTQTPVSGPTQPQEPVKLTQAQLDAIEEYLNDTANNGFVGDNDYAAPSEIDLNNVFYNGAGINVDFDNWDDTEKQAVLDATGWQAFENRPLKITREAANALLLEKCGLSLAEFPEGLPKNYHYVEAYDAFYTMHGDTNYAPITVSEGEIDKDGRYIVLYATAFGETKSVTLLKTTKGYQFISNSKN